MPNQSIKNRFMDKVFFEPNSGCWLCKFSEFQVSVIKKLLHFGTMTGREIAKIFNVSYATISLIRSGKRWGHIL